ncbi:MAG: acyl-CoA dehydrogenase family protein [Chloroflexi bacterium]|nr:acyl-CoA dehydrogenase family protein [Chloroflexota bacterium]
MDFQFSHEDEAFRLEVRQFIKSNWKTKDFDLHTLNVRAYDVVNEDLRAKTQVLEKKLVAKGWWTMHWPVAWGGQDASFGKQFAYVEELGYADAPRGYPETNVTGVLMIHGNEWLKRQLLPKMARAEIDWAQGYSEPNAGTDLASLQTRGVEDGDDIVVTGQKIWTSVSNHSDWYHVLVRTDPTAPKHRGITYLAMPLRDERGELMPGIVMRPLIDFFGQRRWNEVFMEGVRVPKRYVIGEMNRGWYAAMTTLNFERTGIESAARNIGTLDRFIALARRLKFNGEPVLEDDLVRHKLADIRMTLEADRMLSYRVASMQARGEVPQAEGAISGWRALHTSKYVFWPRLAQIIGPYMQALKGEHRAPGNGIIGTNYMLSQNESGGGGGIALGANIIANRGLGLPR